MSYISDVKHKYELALLEKVQKIGKRYVKVRERLRDIT
jgi:hypothetical protein